MEAVSGSTSYMVQLSEYKSLIASVVPEPSTWPCWRSELPRWPLSAANARRTFYALVMGNRQFPFSVGSPAFLHPSIPGAKCFTLV